MSSLQALLDAQGGQRSQSGSGTGRGNAEIRNRGSWSDSGRSQQVFGNHERDSKGRGYGNGNGNHSRNWQSTYQRDSWSTQRNSRERERPRSSRDGGSGGGGRRGNEQTSEPTYEERRANIEQRAIEESCREASSNRRWNKTSCTYNKEDDIESLMSWVGPLVDEKCTYFQDREKRYPFYTDEHGFRLLQNLMETNRALLKLNQNRIEDEAGIMTVSEAANNTAIGEYDAKDVMIRIGQGLYAHKPTLRTKGVTWSTEEYSHPGLQRMYLRMKSIQRFTEVWCLLERSDALGVFDKVTKESGIVRIAAVGGGPGYELLATKLFFAERFPGIELELICMDLCPAWRPYVEQLGFRFVEYDINNEEGTNPLEVMEVERDHLHFCIVSCLMIYCTNKKVLSMFRKLVHEDGVEAILVSERGERTSACKMMEDLGGKVIRLIDQSVGMDERQAIWCSQEFCDKSMQTCNPDYEAHQNESVFPNVPYCEHKERRSGSGRAGGHDYSRR